MNQSKHFEILFCSTHFPPSGERNWWLLSLAFDALSHRYWFHLQCEAFSFPFPWRHVSMLHVLLFFFFWAGSLWSVFVLFLLGIDFKEGTDKEGMPLWSDHPLQARSFTSVGFDLNAIQSIVPLLCGHTCFLGMRCVQGAGNSCFNRGPGVAKANTKANRGSTWTKAEQDVQPSRLGSSTKDTNRSLLDHEAMREDSGDVGLSCFSAL